MPCFRVILFLTVAAGLLPAGQDQSPPVPPASDKAPEKKKPDGGVPAGAARFCGTVTGTVETINEQHTVFKVKITKAAATAESKANQPGSLVGAVVEVHAGQIRKDDQKHCAPGHREWIAALKPGDTVTVPVIYGRAANRLKMKEVPPQKPAPRD